MTPMSNGRANPDEIAAAQDLIAGGKLPAAVKRLRSLKRRHPEDTSVTFLLGVACFESGLDGDALAAFEEAFARTPASREVQTNLAAALAGVGRMDEAVSMLLDVLGQDPEDPRALSNLAQAYLAQGDTDLSIQFADRLIAAHPDAAEGYFQRGTVHLRSGRTEDALCDYRAGLEIDPEDPRLYYNLGYCQYTAGRHKEAAKAFGSFCDLDPEYAMRYAYGNAERLLRQAEVLRLRSERIRESRRGGLIGASPQMADLFEMLDLVAPEDVTVLIRGESGTGKEIVAGELHTGSRRKQGPFVALNVAAVPDNLIESELFGHRKGAFTDAKEDREGLLETASGGTLFLDEVAEMSLPAQAKLLRVLEDRKVRRLGDRRERSVDVRVVTATNKDLRQLADSGAFRSDLYYRLKVLELYIPPLRERSEDIELLVEHFLTRHAKRYGKAEKKIDAEAFDRLESYPWPGNVRELSNTIESAVILSRSDVITADDLPPEIVPENRPAPPKQKRPPDDPESERTRILQALNDARWNRGKAAEILGISRRHIYRLMEKHGIVP